MEIGCTHEKCTGCMACVNSCPRDAVEVVQDTQGFMFPKIDETQCVSCGKCQKVCPQLASVRLHKPLHVYAMLAKDDELRERSSSGGIFSLLARCVLKNDGIVFGAAFDEKWHVYHRSANNEDELKTLRTSKYVQSDIGLIFREVREALAGGKYVLFSGTPCQVDGLRHFLGKEDDRLLTVDLVCHGIPSPGVYAKWLEHEISVHGKIKTMSFKKKVPGWKSTRARIEFENGDTVDCKQNEGFMGGFLQNIYLRKSCYQCSYAASSRVGDITLGDYWGYCESKPERIEDDDRGISLVTVNTTKGENALKQIRSQTALASRTIEDAVRGNPVMLAPSKRSEKYDAFWEDYDGMSWEELAQRYMPKTPERPDPISPDDRRYYAIPFVKRHRRHRIHCVKMRVVTVLKRMIKK